MRTILAIMLLGIGAADAHDIYTDLIARDGGSCCNGKDCHPAPYRMTAAGVEMLVDGRWVLVPEDVIQYRTLPGTPAKPLADIGAVWRNTTPPIALSCRRVQRPWPKTKKADT
jgi:hypothetical protein